MVGDLGEFYYEPDEPQWDEDEHGIPPDEVPANWLPVLDADGSWTTRKFGQWLEQRAEAILPPEISSHLDWEDVAEDFVADGKAYIGGAGCFFINHDLAAFFGVK